MIQQLGWRQFFAQQIGIDDMEMTPPVRVVEVRRSGLRVCGNEVELTVPPRADATVGDWLLLNAERPQDSTLLERTSLLKRRAPGSDRQVQLIAANIDTVFIVSSCNLDFNVARLERYLAMAFEAEITPVIVLTKLDLADDPDSYVTQARSISDAVEIVTLDARGDEPLEKLAPWCKAGETVAFLGSSGVGKSTLANALSGTDDIATQAIREDDARGRHTTTHRQLHQMPSGCLVLDTPGMREIQLADAMTGIGDVFADLSALAQNCRFRDCMHESEPGCAVLAAVEAGDFDAARIARWRKLLAEEAFNSASLAQRRAMDKNFGKAIKRVLKSKKQR